MAALINFNKELSRFTLKYKNELLEEIKTVLESEEDLSTYIENAMTAVQTDLVALDKKTKPSKRQASGGASASSPAKAKSAPRPLSAYNKFIKKELPEIAKENPDMDNKTRMSKASEKWKTLTDKQKEEYKNMEFKA